MDVVSPYVKLERSGTSLKGRCPFHSEKTPSFFVSPDRGSYHCFGCGVGGDMFTFIQEIEGVDFKGALKLLADKAGVTIVFEKSQNTDSRDRLYTLLEDVTLFYVRALSDQKGVQKYLKERGLLDKTIQDFRIGWAPDGWGSTTEYLKKKSYTEKEIEEAGLAKKGDRGLYDRFRSRIMFPIFDATGRVVAFSGRIFSDTGAYSEAPKYINSPETVLFHKSKILYGYDRAKQAIRKLNFSILVEGQIDLVMSHQSGWGNTVAVSGTALTPEHVALLKRMSDNIVVALDADSAGILAATKSAHMALRNGMEVKVAGLPVGNDPADIIVEGGAEAWKKIIRESKHIISFLLEVLEREARDARSFQKAVEQTVLPFVRDTENPIDKEKFIHLVGDSVGVSDEAIKLALERIPLAHDTSIERNSTRAPSIHMVREEIKYEPRIRQLWGIVLWQKLSKKASIEPSSVEKEIERILGKETYLALEKILSKDKDALVFAAEDLYKDDEHLERSIDDLLHMIEKQEIQKKLSAATRSLKQAEHEGQEALVEQALEACKKYTEELAKIQAKG